VIDFDIYRGVRASEPVAAAEPAAAEPAAAEPVAAEPVAVAAEPVAVKRRRVPLKAGARTVATLLLLKAGARTVATLLLLLVGCAPGLGEPCAVGDDCTIDYAGAVCGTVNDGSLRGPVCYLPCVVGAPVAEQPCVLTEASTGWCYPIAGACPAEGECPGYCEPI